MTTEANPTKIYFAYRGSCSGHKTVAGARKCLDGAKDYVVAIENGKTRAITKKEAEGQESLGLGLKQRRLFMVC